MPVPFEELLNQRRSVRAYTNEPVSQETMQDICRAARRAPSGANLQPGKFHVLAGQALSTLVARLDQAVNDGLPFDEEYSYFPPKMSAELKSRQRNAGYALYESLGISRRDIAARREQFERNYAFFGAPAGVVVTIDRDMGKGCFMDLGMAMMSFLLAVEAKGLAASGIGALANYGSVVHKHLELQENELVVCGISVGFAAKAAPVNQFNTERLDLEDFTTFQGFDEGQQSRKL